MKKKEEDLLKKNLGKEADALWYQILFTGICEVCGARANQVHHFYYKGQFGHLRYDLQNGITICMGCHFCIHHKDPKPIEKIIEDKRGRAWADLMEYKSKNKESSFKTLKYYQDTVNRLRSALDNSRKDTIINI